AALAYAVSAQSGPDVFAGLLTEDFCPRLDDARMICGDGIHGGTLLPVALGFPWLDAAPGRAPRCAAGEVEAFARAVP
ncbi:hypothetical protein, partial [Escherichia coli]